METKRLLKALGKYYPKRLAESYDHVGLQLGKLPPETKSVFLVLDFDRFVFEKAAAFRPDLVITHHPFFFGRPREILERDPEKKALAEAAAEAGLCIYSFHTNFDAGTPGMNDELCRRLGLSAVKPLSGEPCARGGLLPAPMGIREFAAYAKERLGVPYGRLLDGGKKVVRKVAVIGGAGSFAWRIAKEEGYDVFVSGDCPHHAFREMAIAGYDYLDLPHEIEKAFVLRMKETLLSIDPTLRVSGAEHEIPPRII